MRRSRLALTVLVVVLGLTGCLRQPGDANDNGPQDQPTRPAGVVREPVPVESPPLTVDQPEGPKADRSPAGD